MEFIPILPLTIWLLLNHIIESKRQDGWVEGGARKDGRGNAHERSCKFFTPGLLKIM